MITLPGFASAISADWREQLAFVVHAMREMSSQTDPQEMSRAYAKRVRTLIPVDGSLSLSRRDLARPFYRVTRSSRWQEEVNPWKQKHLLPLHRGGALAEWLYGDEPRLLNDFHVAESDPAFEYLDGFRSIAAIPMYDKGEALNMVLLLRREPGAFAADQFPQMVWMSNLYGRATHNLVLSEQLKDAYEAVDYELKVVADIQRALLPRHMPKVPTLSVAAHYQTSARAGGDYYDFFPIADGRWGVLIADVSGHGTPAAVIMAMTHALAHTFPGKHDRPGRFLEYLNRKLYELYTGQSGAFVTAFFGLFDPESRELAYASAGHNPPRLKRCSEGTLALLDEAGGLPLGLSRGYMYEDATLQLVPGDQLILYTDGITEAYNDADQQFGMARLDHALEDCAVGADTVLTSLLDAVEAFTGGRTPHDDRTLLVLKVS